MKTLTQDDLRDIIKSSEYIYTQVAADRHFRSAAGAAYVGQVNAVLLANNTLHRYSTDTQAEHWCRELSVAQALWTLARQFMLADVEQQLNIKHGNSNQH
ncbi:MAG: hypothetical protein KDJ27_03880 [Gammaproteobacteria bacterium]|nr:hypothetical protein [Gammaproteobacteria bacterium]